VLNPAGEKMTLRKSDAAILLALLFSTIVVFSILRGLGFAPRVPEAAAKATSVVSAPVAPLPFETVVEELLGEHRALEAAELAMSGEARLKALHLDCTGGAPTDGTDVEQAVFCQAVADALVLRYFDGKPERLFAWWQEQPEEEHASLQRAAHEEQSPSSAPATELTYRRSPNPHR
jgi:hypothetical protein